MKAYGWSPDLPDIRDHHVALAASQLPVRADLQRNMPPVYDQGQLGSCTANAVAAAVEFENVLQYEKRVTPSRLFIYYGERVIENTVKQDAGAQIRDGIKVVAKHGAPPEAVWPYDISKFTRKPPAAAFKAGLHHRAISYARVPQTLAGIRAVLAGGHPVVFGFTVYDAFESPSVAQSGVLNLPGPGEKVVGGHAVLIVGYDDHLQRFKVRNSWGASWGLKGYFLMPYAYATDPGLASDFWTVTRTS